MKLVDDGTGRGNKGDIPLFALTYYPHIAFLLIAYPFSPLRSHPFPLPSSLLLSFSLALSFSHRFLLPLP